MNDNIPTEVEEQVREIAREEAKDVYDVQVEDGDGTSWSLSSIMQRFEVDRRTALKALGLVAVGYTAPIAVLKAVSGTAEAAATDDLTVPGTLDAGSVSTGDLNDIGVVFPSESDLQEKVNNYDGVALAPGVHSNHSYPVDVPNGTSIYPLAGGPGGEQQDQSQTTVLDAGGGVALQPADTTLARGITIGPISVRGTIRFHASENKRCWVDRAIVTDATTSAGTGRGLEFRNNTYLCGTWNVKATHNELEGLYVGNTGQMMHLQPELFGNGTSTDDRQLYVSATEGNGGVSRWFAPVIGEAGADGVHNIVIDQAYHEYFYGVQVESAGTSSGTSGDGIRVTGTSGRTTGVMIHGGRIRDSSGAGVSVGNASGGNDCRGVTIGGNLNLEGNASGVVWGPNSWRCHHGRTIGGNGTVYNHSITVDGSAFIVTGDRSSQMARNADPSDLTSETAIHDYEIRWHDGTDGSSTNAAGPAMAKNAGGVFTSIIDGAIID